MTNPIIQWYRRAWLRFLLLGTDMDLAILETQRQRIRHDIADFERRRELLALELVQLERGAHD